MPASDIKARHVDRGVLIGTFATKVVSVCPKCRAAAIGTCESTYSLPFVPKDARIHCLNCSFELRQIHQNLAGRIDQLKTSQIWFGPVSGVAKSVCPNCGFKWLKQRVRHNSLTGRTRQFVLIGCPSCQQTTEVPLQWTIERIGHAAIDPIFGLPLYLQIPCCGKVLWVYNGEHLERLRQYVEASLRERVGVLGWSMFSRLPGWLTAAKNRDAVVSSLARLEARLKTAG